NAQQKEKQTPEQTDFVSLYKADEPKKSKKPEPSAFVSLYGKDEPPPPKAQEVPPHSATIMANVKEIERKAYDKGYKEGNDKGYKEGNAKGYKEGNDKGYKEAHDKGYKEGSDKGYKEGQDKGYKEGYDKGLIQGEIEGKNSAQAKTEENIERLAGIVNAIENMWTNLIAANEKQLIDLICRIAEKVVHGRVIVDHDTVKRSILYALTQIPEPIDVTINVNPEDYEYIEAVKNLFFEQVKKMKHVAVIADPSVSKGGARIEAKGGQVESTIESKLEAVKDSIIKAKSFNF
ncbi:MAG: hypothetical protein HQK78_12030, partial [Desulfobacterales bacterium]|nr:hypothetical protein [Desulfobacterales bacterium]